MPLLNWVQQNCLVRGLKDYDTNNFKFSTKPKFSYQPSNKTLNCMFQIQAMRICQAIKKGNLRGQDFSVECRTQFKMKHHFLFLMILRN